MSQDLNMQVIEQITSALHQQNKQTISLADYFQQIYEILHSTLGITAMSVYRHGTDSLIPIIHCPASDLIDSKTISLTSDSIWHQAASSESAIKDEQSVFLPLHIDRLAFGIANLTLADSTLSLDLDMLANLLSFGMASVIAQNMVKHQDSIRANLKEADSLEKVTQALQSDLNEVENLTSKLIVQQENASTLEETYILYALTNKLIKAQDMADMLQVLYDYFGKAVDRATLIEVTYDQNYQAQDMLIRYRIEDSALQELDFSLKKFLAIEQLSRLQAVWEENPTDIVFVDDTSVDDTNTSLQFLKQQNIASALMISLSNNGHLVYMIVLSWYKQTPFSEQTRRIFKGVQAQIDSVFQRQRLLREAQITAAQLGVQVRSQRAINEFANFASTIRSEKRLLDKGAETLITALTVDHVGITLIDPDSATATIITDLPDKGSTGLKISVTGEDSTWKQLRQGQHILISDIENSTDITESTRKSLQSVGAKAVLLLPLLDSNSKLIGSVGLDIYTANYEVSDETLQTARLINAQITTYLQNIRLLNNSQKLANQMQQIAKYSETVQSRLALEEILHTTLHFGMRVFDNPFMDVVIYDENTQKLLIMAYHQGNVDEIKLYQGQEMPVESTLAGQVWREREPAYIADIENSIYQHPVAQQIRSLYAVPLISRGVTRGIIELGFPQAQHITDIDKSAFLQLSNQLSVALENAGTYAQSQKLARSKALVNEISTHLQQQMDMDSLLNTTAMELGRALGAKRARIRLGIQEAANENQ